MSNFKRYTMVIRRDSDGFATPALKIRQDGEVLKFDEVKDLLQTDVQPLKAETLRCMECEQYFNDPSLKSPYCYECKWFPNYVDNFIQRKTSIV